VVFASEEEAVAAASAHTGPIGLICLARSGLLVTSDGIIRGGPGQEKEVSLLGREDKLDRLQAEIADLGAKISAWEQRTAANRQRREEVREKLIGGRGQISILDEDLGHLHARIGLLESRQASGHERLQTISREEDGLTAELQRLTEAETTLLQEAEESGRQKNSSSLRRDELVTSVTVAETQRDELRGVVEELRLAHQGLQAQKEQTESSLTHLRQSMGELAAQRERLGQEIDLAQQERQSLTGQLTTARQELEAGFNERERRRQLVRAAADAIGALHEKTAVWHDRVKEIEDKRSACREKIYQVETELATLAIKQRNLEERIEEQYQGTFAELVAEVDLDPLPRQLERVGDVFQLDQANALLAEAREKFDRLGPVNQLALEEYDTKSERLTFLQQQRGDVQKAKEDLATAITRINRTARKLFSETFEDVRRNYIAVFQTLFEGGRADLELIRTDDPLESQIHIVAQPRGKVVNNVALLSGGERCLTALSLLFAVYLVKPSPFCMLDETTPTSGASCACYGNSPATPSSWWLPTTSSPWRPPTTCTA